MPSNFKTTYPPLEIKYTEACKIFDEEIQKPTRDDATLYRYLYSIIFALASKGNYFKGDIATYDAFALYAATNIYMRCLDPRRKLYDGVTHKLKPIKSILNYLKSVLDLLRVDFQQTEFDNIIDPNEYEYINGDKIKRNMESSVQQDYNHGVSDAVEGDIRNILYYIQKIIKQSPYKNDIVMCNKIYQSCLLSMINSLTLNNINKTMIERKTKRHSLTDAWLLMLYQKERKNSTIVWNMDPSIKDYITLLTNRIRKKLVDNIDNSVSSYILNADTVQDILNSEMASYNEEKN